MTVDEKLFIEEESEHPPGLFVKKMGSISLSNQFNSFKEWAMSQKKTFRPLEEFGTYVTSTIYI